MNDEQWQELARRAVACKGWRWMRGIAASDGCVVAMESDLEEEDHSWTDGIEVWCDDEPRLPDLRDPATMGCLLALVREAWGDPAITACWQDNSHRSGAYVVSWRLWGATTGYHYGEHPTEADALVGALEAAP